VTIANNYVAGYDRGIHAESVYDNVIKNNSVEKCGASMLISAAKNCTIESNTFTANRRFTVGTFINYGNCYSYGANTGCSFLNNKLKVVGGLGYTSSYVALLFSGLNTIKDILVEGNIIEGGFSANGGENFYVQNNTFNADADLRTVFFNGSVSFLNNTFKEGVRLRAIGIAGKSVISGNNFYDVSTNNIFEVTNPSSSGFVINENRFHLKQGATNSSVMSVYMTSDKIGEMSGNVVIAPHTERRNLNLVDFGGSATLNKIYTLKPNLLINGIGEIQSLKISSVYGMSRNTLEFYKGGNTATEPDDDIYYQVGSRVYLADSTSANNPAFFIALNSGYAAKTAWASSTSVSLGAIRYNGSNVYKADAAGTTGVTAPTHTSGSVSDGGVSWTYLGSKSLFKSVAAKAAPVTDATGVDNTAATLNALLASLRNAGVIQ
jgi:parallel beta-helix repeat protein